MWMLRIAKVNPLRLGSVAVDEFLDKDGARVKSLTNAETEDGGDDESTMGGFGARVELGFEPRA